MKAIMVTVRLWWFYLTYKGIYKRIFKQSIQKQILYFKHNNTLYNQRKTVEEKDGIITKDDIANISLIINENSKVKPVVDEKMIELNLIKESLTSKNNSMSVKMKSAMSKVINKYIEERKKLMKKQKIVNTEEIKAINDKNLLQLNFSIKNINNSISHIKFLRRNNK